VKPLTFYAGSLPRTPFAELVPAAAAAGFGAITLWPNVWRHALTKGGFTLATMRTLLQDHGLVLTDVDACRDWIPAPTTDATGLGPQRSLIPRSEFFDVCIALGGTTVIAVHVSDAALVLERETESFARLCDDAARHGLRVALEAVAFGGIPRMETAWAIVQGAGRANGGVTADVAHHVRSGADPRVLAQIPGDRIFCVQLCDGPREAPADLAQEAMYERRLPGEGEWDIDGYLRTLTASGVRAPVGCEVYNSDFERRPTMEVMRDLAGAARRALARAGA